MSRSTPPRSTSNRAGANAGAPAKRPCPRGHLVVGTILDLLDPAVVPRKLQRKVRGFQMALPLAVLYLVIDRDLAAEGLLPTNYWVYPHDDPQGEYARVRRGEFSDDPAVFVSSASLKDRDNQRLCPQGQTNLQLMAAVPPQPSSWGLELGKERGEAYQSAKDELYLAGASTRFSHGIPGTMGGGVQAATAILGRSAIKAVTGT